MKIKFCIDVSTKYFEFNIYGGRLLNLVFISELKSKSLQTFMKKEITVSI